MASDGHISITQHWSAAFHVTPARIHKTAMALLLIQAEVVVINRIQCA
jgi:hypothetical protein